MERIEKRLEKLERIESERKRGEEIYYEEKVEEIKKKKRK